MVVHEQQHPVARHQPFGPQACGQARAAGGPLGVGGVWLGAVEDGSLVRAGAGLAQQQIDEGHGCLLFGVFVQDNGWRLGAEVICY